MFNKANPHNYFSKVIDVYLYNELYKRGIIKSKSFNFSSHLDDVRSKLMYILKSMVTSSVKEKDLSSVFTSVKFSKSEFMIDWHMNSHTLIGKISLGYARTYISNAQCGFASIGTNRLDFMFRDIYSIYGDSYETINCKEKVNEIINDILFTQTAVCSIGEFVKEMKELRDEGDLTKFKYLRYAVNGLFHGGLRDLMEERISRIIQHPDANIILELHVPLTNGTTDTLKVDLEKFINEKFTEYCAPQIPQQENTEDDGEGRYVYVAGQRVRLND